MPTERTHTWWVWEALSVREVNAESFSDRDWWAKGQPTISEDNRLWRQHLLLIDLYKYYLDMAWKAVVWYYTTTGILLAFVLNNADGPHASELRWLLVFVAIMGLGFSYMQLRGASHLFQTIGLLEYTARELHLPGRPHVEFAVAYLLVNCVMFLAIALASFALFLTVFT